ncbi:hypothetical protein CRH15_20880 [Lelliottia amnigena]|nr:hypothetical protein CRH15_20880 [Lelliottia amnigena]QXB20566.1 hypothetical protein I6L76_15245 [Lelliottia amnigena]
MVSGEDEAAALALLKSPDLAARITADMAACGVVGESTNLLTGYLAAVSRKTVWIPARSALAICKMKQIIK